jgi:hypothetical protein
MSQAGSEGPVPDEGDAGDLTAGQQAKDTADELRSDEGSASEESDSGMNLKAKLLGSSKRGKDDQD